LQKQPDVGPRVTHTQVSVPLTECEHRICSVYSHFQTFVFSWRCTWTL